MGGKILDLYLREAGKYPLLSQEEERELLDRYQKNKDKEALNKLVESNLRIVVFFVKEIYDRFKKKIDIEFEDLIQEGNLGLIEAIKRFKGKNNRLSTYAVWWIKNYVFNAIARSLSPLPLNPPYILNQLIKLGKMSQKFLEEKGYLPTAKELAEKTGYSLRLIELGLSFMFFDSFELDAPILGSSSSKLGCDLLPTEDLPLNEENGDIKLIFLKEIKRIFTDPDLEVLNWQEKVVLWYYYGFYGGKPMILEEVKEILGLRTRERVRQIREKAIKKIRRYFRSQVKEIWKKKGKREKARQREFVSSA